MPKSGAQSESYKENKDLFSYLSTEVELRANSIGTFSKVDSYPTSDKRSVIKR